MSSSTPPHYQQAPVQRTTSSGAAGAKSGRLWSSMVVEEELVAGLESSLGGGGGNLDDPTRRTIKRGPETFTAPILTPGVTGVTVVIGGSRNSTAAMRGIKRARISPTASGDEPNASLILATGIHESEAVYNVDKIKPFLENEEETEPISTSSATTMSSPSREPQQNHPHRKIKRRAKPGRHPLAVEPKEAPSDLVRAGYDQERLFNATFPVEEEMEAMAAANNCEGNRGDALSRLGQLMADALGEKATALIIEAVHDVGRERALALFEQCRQWERDGGMLIHRGTRRRTPGGVFLKLYKDFKEAKLTPIVRE